MIAEYKCSYDNITSASAQIAKENGLRFPDVYMHADSMVTLAKAIKGHEKAKICEMPFCHTVEAEAMGADINLGDENAGPRARAYLTTDIEDILSLPGIDFSRGRIHEVLMACNMLEEQGEHVVLEIAGPFIMMNGLIDIKYMVKCMRKDKDLALKVLERLGDEAVRYAEEAVKYGVKMISYADSTCSVEILGQERMAWITNEFTCRLVKRLKAVTEGKALLMLCPKTTFALIGTENAELKDRMLSKEMTYPEGCIESIGRLAAVGQVCVKKRDFRLAGGKIKEVVLL